MSLKEVANWLNPMISGWINYYGKYNKSALRPVMRQINFTLIKWSTRKYKTFRYSSGKNLTDLANMFRSQVQGWVNYYGRYYKSAMYPFLRDIERCLIRWATRKYKRLRRHKRRAKYWLGRIWLREPNLFVHWRLCLGSSVG